jgi:hypothetical protein
MVVWPQCRRRTSRPIYSSYTDQPGHRSGLRSAGDLHLAEALPQTTGLATAANAIFIAENLAKGAWEGGANRMAVEITPAADGVHSGAGRGGERPEVSLPRPEEARAGRPPPSRPAQRRELDLALDFLETWFRDMMAMAGAGEAISTTIMSWNSRPSRMNRGSIIPPALEVMRHPLKRAIMWIWSCFAGHVLYKLQEVL